MPLYPPAIVYKPTECFSLVYPTKCTIDAVDRASAQGHTHVVRWLLENRPGIMAYSSRG